MSTLYHQHNQAISILNSDLNALLHWKGISILNLKQGQYE